MQKSEGSGMVNLDPSFAIQREGLEMLHHVRVLKCNWLDNNNNKNIYNIDILIFCLILNT